MIRNTILVLSGKGGVGKSTVAANLAFWLAEAGYNTGLLDVDLHGPSIPALFGIDNVMLVGTENSIEPHIYNPKLKIVSMGLLLDDKDTPVVWRGPMKAAFIKKFMTDVQWGDLDYMIVDCPPGTGDELLSVIADSQNLKGVIVVTTPQRLAVADARRAIKFCSQINLAVLGVVENMSGFVCSKCGAVTEPFLCGGGESLAQEEKVGFLGKIPLSMEILDSSEKGSPVMKLYPDAKSTKSMIEVFGRI